MHTITHLSMSLAIRKLVEKHLPIKLDKVGFMLGNIKPDFAPRLVKIPHYRDDAIHFVKSEIKALLNYQIIEHTKCTRYFSQRLGVILHYLSDFFCYAHSKNFKGNMFNHYLYEIGLSNYFKANFKKNF